MLILATLVAAVSFACGSSTTTSNSTSEPDMTLRLSADFPTSYVLNPVATALGTALSDKTHGHLKINFFPNAQLYTGPAAVTAMANGTLDMAFVSTPSAVTLLPQYDALGLPFGGEDYPVVQKLGAAANPAFKALISESASKGLRLFPGTWPTPYAGVAIHRANATSLDAMSGLKIRSAGGATETAIINGFGGSPIALTPPEVPGAVSQGTVQGVYGSFAYWNSLGFGSGWTALNFGSYTTGIGYVFLMSDRIWKSLPSNYQAAISSTLAAQNRDFYKSIVATSDSDVAKFKSNGGSVYTPSKTEQAKMATITAAAWTAFGRKQPAMLKSYRQGVIAAGGTPPS